LLATWEWPVSRYNGTDGLTWDQALRASTSTRVGCGLNGSCSGRPKLRDPLLALGVVQANRLLKDGLFKKKVVHCSPSCFFNVRRFHSIYHDNTFLGLLAMVGHGRGVVVGRRNAPVGEFCNNDRARKPRDNPKSPSIPNPNPNTKLILKASSSSSSSMRKSKLAWSLALHASMDTSQQSNNPTPKQNRNPIKKQKKKMREKTVAT
jgi:hypothetical protein